MTPKKMVQIRNKKYGADWLHENAKKAVAARKWRPKKPVAK